MIPEPTYWMVDCETLSLRPNAMLLSFAAVQFMQVDGVIEETQAFEWHIDITRQPERHIDVETLAWWLDAERADALRVLTSMSPRSTLRDALTELRSVMVDRDRPVYVFAQGHVDVVWLEDGFRYHAIPLPWRYWNVVDLRTLLLFVPPPENVASFPGAIKHTPLSDCRVQIAKLSAALSKAGISLPRPVDR